MCISVVQIESDDLFSWYQGFFWRHITAQEGGGACGIHYCTHHKPKTLRLQLFTSTKFSDFNYYADLKGIYFSDFEIKVIKFAYTD